jgi:ribosome-associated translation inhibitor RaiA
MAFKQIMSLKWDFLPEKYVEGKGFQAFLSIIEDFVETRSESGVYPDHRLVTEDVHKAMNDLQLLADANEKQQILNENPDVFDNVDPGQMTLQQVKDHLKNQLAAAGLIEKALSPKKKQELKEKRDSVKAKTRERLSLEESVQSLVGQFKDAFNKIANGEKSGTGLDNIIKDDYVSGISDHIQDAPEAIIKAANKLRQDFNQKAKLHAASVIHYVINQVDTSTMGPVELRMFYYNLQSMLADGDRMFDYSGLIPADVAEILTKTHEFRNPDFESAKSISDIENHVSSIYLLLDKMGVTQESKNALQNIVANFATQIEVAQRYETEVLIPLEHHFEKRANKLGADVHNTYKLEDSGIFAALRQPIGNESMYDAIMAAKKQLSRSISNRKKHSERKLRESALREEATLNALMDGIEQNPTNAEDILEANAKRVIGEGYVQYVRDIASFFSWTQPMAEFTTKFVLGRTYQPIRNYIPFTQHRVNNSDGIKAKDTQTNSVTLQGKSDDEIKEFGISLSEITLDGTANEGMSSTYERKRKIGNDYALILNVKHSFQTRGRLNILDYVTATDRRGVAATLNSPILNKFLGDETQGLQTQRRAHLKKTITQLWKQAVLSNRYVTTFEVGLNSIIGNYNAYLLSSAHQFPAQLASAYASYTMSNMFSPKKLLALKQAGVFYARYISGNLTEREKDFVEDITYAIKARSVDMVHDKNSNLRMEGRGILERAIGSNYSSKVKAAHEKLIRASAIAFRASDALSGKPIMLAEYLANESARIGHDVSFEQLVNMQKNPASYQRALNQTERHLAPGHKSRRSDFTSGVNKYGNLSKLAGFRFVSHMLNMATHSSAAMRDFVDAPMSEKPQHAAYVIATVSQAFVFAATRSYIQLAVGGLILSCLKGGLDDEEEQKAAIEELLKEREDGRKSAKEKEIIDARINAIKGFAEITQKIAAKGDNGIIMRKALSDSVSQMHVFGTLADQVNGTSIVGHAIFDKGGRTSFNSTKLSEISRLQEELKSSRLLPSERVEKLTEIKYLESQQYIDTWFTLPGRGLGLKGPVFDVVEQWGSSAFSILDGEVSGADIASTLSLIGIGQSDVTRFFKDKEKISKIQKELDNRILEIEKKYEKK